MPLSSESSSLLDSEDEGTTLLRNVSLYLPDSMGLLPRRLESSSAAV